MQANDNIINIIYCIIIKTGGHAHATDDDHVSDSFKILWHTPNELINSTAKILLIKHRKNPNLLVSKN